jgi:Domain of unknown function (DUF4902)
MTARHIAPDPPAQEGTMYRWSTLALPQVEWPTCHVPPTRFRHLHTTVDEPELPRAREVGYTTWQSIEAGPMVRLGWDWALIDDGIVVLADPLGINSNLCFLQEQEPLHASRVAAHLNAIVHALPWQATILKALRRLRADGPPARAATAGRRREDSAERPQPAGGR